MKYQRLGFTVCLIFCFTVFYSQVKSLTISAEQLIQIKLYGLWNQISRARAYYMIRKQIVLIIPFTDNFCVTAVIMINFYERLFSDLEALSH